MVCGGGGLSELYRGRRTFGELGLQSRSDLSSVRNCFEGSFTDEITVSGRTMFEGGCKSAASEARKKFKSTASEFQIEEDHYEYPSTE